MKKILVLSLFLICFGVVGNATTHITGCQFGGTPITGGSYDFTGDITIGSGYNYSICLAIIDITSNVYIDCGGHTLIDNSNITSPFDIRYTGSGVSGFNVIIQNCNITASNYTAVIGYNQSVQFQYGTFTNTNFLFTTPPGTYSNTYSMTYNTLNNGDIEFYNGWGGIAYGNTINVTSSAHQTINYGVFYYNSWAANCQYNVITGYSTTAGLDDGIMVQNTDNITPITVDYISHNTISYVDDVGIEFIGHVRDGDVSHNTISHTARGAIGEWYRLGQNNMVFDNNDFYANSNQNFFDFEDQYNGLYSTYFTNITISNNRYHSVLYAIDASFFGYNPSNTVTVSNVTLTSNDFNDYYNSGGLTSGLYFGGIFSNIHDGSGNRCGSDNLGAISCSN